MSRGINRWPFASVHCIRPQVIYLTQAVCIGYFERLDCQRTVSDFHRCVSSKLLLAEGDEQLEQAPELVLIKAEIVH